MAAGPWVQPTLYLVPPHRTVLGRTVTKWDTLTLGYGNFHPTYCTLNSVKTAVIL